MGSISSRAPLQYVLHGIWRAPLARTTASPSRRGGVPCAPKPTQAFLPSFSQAELTSSITPLDRRDRARTLPAAKWLEGDSDAGRRIIEACLPFVISIALEYRRWGVPIEDVVQQGNIGLLRAAVKFDLVEGLPPGDLRGLLDPRGDPRSTWCAATGPGPPRDDEG